MKKRNLVKKALLPAVIAVVCSIVALTSVSYAWFTMGNTASVESIEVNVQAADGVQISADAVSWKSILPVAELKAQTSNQFPAADGKILPVSSVGNVVNGKQEMFIGEVQEDGKTLVTTKESEVQTGGNFIAFDFYVSLTTTKEFYLDAGSTVVALTGAEKNTQYAVRVSFINLGTADLAADAPALGNAYNGAADYVWEPNSTSHIPGVASGKLDYYGVKVENANGFNKDATDDADNLAKVTTIDPAGAAQKLFDLGAGYTKIRVYIWLEGQDADCLNDISGGGFQVNLNFKTEDPSA